MTHVHNFQYSQDASTPGVYVTICSGCGDVKITELKRAPASIETVVDNVFEKLYPFDIAPNSRRNRIRPGAID